MKAVTESPVVFSVVTVIHKDGAELSDYFTSLASQSLDFASHIELILVGGSVSSQHSETVRQWADQFPDSITLLAAESGDALQGRSLGLAHARGKWVTFIDEADFVDKNYFAVVHEFLMNHPQFDGHVIAANPLSFNEVTREARNDHPLGYRYRQAITVVDLAERPENIQRSVVSAFFRKDALRQSGLGFDGRVQPDFSEGHLIYRFFLQTGNTKIALLRDALYFHRLRKSPGSLIDPDWGRMEKYRDQIVFGYLDLIRVARKRFGNVPEYIQYMIVFDLREYMEKMLESQLPFAFSREEAEEFMALLRTVFSHIDANAIVLSSIPVLEWRVRIAMLYALKQVNPEGLPFLAHEAASDKHSVLLVRYTGEPETCVCRMPEGENAPMWEKRVERDFYGHHLCVEHWMWFSIQPDIPMTFAAEGRPSFLMCGEQSFEAATGQQLLAALYRPLEQLPERIQRIREAAHQPKVESRYAGCWLLMDRVERADDNAEHLYRWLSKSPECGKSLFFVLDRKSPDWDRLRLEGFHLLAHNSHEHLMACFHAEWLISSHLHQPLFDPLGTKSAFGLPGYKVAFLQHGIIKDDMSRWVLPMPLDLFVTSTRQEYESIVLGNYKCTEREVILAGLPRHDALLVLKKNSRSGRLILVCPTWRDNLCNPHTSFAPGSVEAAMFTGSDYYRSWNALTSSEEIADLAEQYGYRFVFLPHPYVSRNIGLFQYSRRFSAKKYAELASVQALLGSCALLITDYSSMAMEAALVGTPVIYYQFGEEPPFFSGHTYIKGYFDYENDGFGPVARDMPTFKACLSEILSNNCKRVSFYEERAERFFTLRDGKNCQRVYDALKERSTRDDEVK